MYGTSGRLNQRKDFNDLKNLAPNGVMLWRFAPAHLPTPHSSARQLFVFVTLLRQGRVNKSH
jgi:hypothetical protein